MYIDAYPLVRDLVKSYIVVMILLFFNLALYSEVTTSHTYLNKLVRSQLGYKDFGNYLGHD